MNCPASFARHASSRRFFSERRGPVEGNSNHHHAAGRFPLPTTQEWERVRERGFQLANSMERAPLPPPPPPPAPPGGGGGRFPHGGGIQMRARRGRGGGGGGEG